MLFINITIPCFFYICIFVVYNNVTNFIHRNRYTRDLLTKSKHSNITNIITLVNT